MMEMSTKKYKADGKRLMILRVLIGAGAGAVVGFGWSRLVRSAGCRTGACPLTSHPVVSTLYGMVVGGLIATSFH